MYSIDSVKLCTRYIARLRELGYTVCQTQYGTWTPEGYHIWFWLSGQPLIELVTHNEEVETMLREY
ncbi:MAG: hypothetical protein ABFD25_03400 [Clostridiaceae bacterium]